jgi:hypothetical protein
MMEPSNPLAQNLIIAALFLTVLLAGLYANYRDRDRQGR